MMRFLKNLCRTESGVVTRAVVMRQFGGPEVLELLHNIPVRNLKRKEVLVRARAVSVNHLETRLRSGYGLDRYNLPFTLGCDVSGEVVKVGNSVRRFKVGQEVFGASHPLNKRGTYADYSILNEAELALKPPSITHVEASAIPFAALTAWDAIRRADDVDRVLVLGGGGSVGFAAIQLAVALGCDVTAATSGSHIDRILAAGALQAVDHTVQDIELALKGKFDFVLDTIGVPKTESIGINFLNNGGKYIKLEDILLSDDEVKLWRRKFGYAFSHGIDYSWASISEKTDSQGLEAVQRLTHAGKLKINVEKTFPITQVREAHEAKEKGNILGKIVLEFD